MAAPVFDGFNVGDTAIVTANLTRNEDDVETLVDADVTCTLRWRNSTAEQVADLEIDHDDTGIYKIRIQLPKAGDWHVRVTATSGTDVRSGECIVRVDQSGVLRT